MHRPLIPLIVKIACLLMLPVAAFAQLPSPSYGWNLGNTLEPPGGEGTWGPAATQSLINAVADAGFNTVRLPVAWNSHANQSTYQIDADVAALQSQVASLTTKMAELESKTSRARQKAAAGFSISVPDEERKPS